MPVTAPHTDVIAIVRIVNQVRYARDYAPLM